MKWKPPPTAFNPEIRLHPTQWALCFSTAVVRVIYGPTGVGKSYGAVAAIIEHARRNKAQHGVNHLRGFVIRDTLENIRRSPLPTFLEVLGPLCETRREDRELVIKTDPPIFIDNLGMDEPRDFQKLQGATIYTFGWLEEPAPIADSERATVGIPEEVFNQALIRACRGPGTPLLMVSMNPADDEHWTYHRFIAPALEQQDPTQPWPFDPAAPLVTAAVFRVQADENIFAREVAQQAVRAAYREGTPEYERYVKGEFAQIYHGDKVTPSFNPALHIAEAPLQPREGAIGVRGWDSWGNPRCVISQQLESGQLRTYDIVIDHSDIESLVKKVKTFLQTPKWKRVSIPFWRDCGDWSMQIHDQSRRYESAKKIIEEEFGTTFEPAPQKFQNTQRLVNEALRRNLATGEPMILICPSCKRLTTALRGKWHYPTNRAGVRTSALPVKDEASHVADAWAAAVCVCLGVERRSPLNVSYLRKIQAHLRKRAQGYSST